MKGSRRYIVLGVLLALVLLGKINTWSDDYSQVDGVIHSSLHTYVKAEVGDIVACVEDRYLVGRYILADEENSYEFHTIFDSKTGRQQSFECRAAVKGDTVVLY